MNVRYCALAWVLLASGLAGTFPAGAQGMSEEIEGEAFYTAASPLPPDCPGR